MTLRFDGEKILILETDNLSRQKKVGLLSEFKTNTAILRKNPNRSFSRENPCVTYRYYDLTQKTLNFN